ncbi:PREDICTED: heparan sulfate 2-O-sulfotransferase pipe-like [Eufriesea mexicana]|uniref:heparan sulfate 2-O-sulfotransferase pipe-like n=1 Tax=Eufriesea mexicana TaxID=516756 RepID=UPI00083C53B5|nr:PREDICTED: heparan sulfate 2-O-sulfotransferase pipe-like [Eufriesea mexicana]
MGDAKFQIFCETEFYTTVEPDNSYVQKIGLTWEMLGFRCICYQLKWNYGNTIRTIGHVCSSRFCETEFYMTVKPGNSYVQKIGLTWEMLGFRCICYQLKWNYGKTIMTIGHYKEAEVLDIDALNNTRRAGRSVLFFNRVPKVGSQTFMELLRRLSMRNGFSFNRDRVQRVETIRLAPIEQVQLATMVSSYAEPSVYIKHVCFTNFTEFNLPQPIYINIVRDPVERVISWYYYVRAPWYYVERKQIFPDLPLPDPNWLKKDFESCVLKADRECRYLEGEIHEGIGDHRRQTLFFCGHSEKCTPFNTVGALERAKMAVEKHYAVVGVLEDVNTTLTVLENYIPRFFRGATDVYYDEVNAFTRINRNFFKPPVSEEVKDMVRSNFTREIEFYQFCKQRLYKQLRALKLTKSTPMFESNSL